MLLDNAGDLAMEAALAPSPAVDELHYQGLLWSLEQLALNGITSVADARVYRTRHHHEIWQRAADEQTLTVRATLGLWAYPGHDDTQQLAELTALYDPDPSDWLQTTQVKLYSDGIVVNTTAAMLEPYVETWGVGDADGLNYFAADRLATYAAQLEAVGFDLHVHTIGDRGVREALDAVAAATAANGQVLDRRHHLTHLEYVHPADVPRFASLGVVADFQTSSEFVEPQHRYLEAWSLGEALIDAEFLPLRAVHDTGAPVTLSSDWDVGSLSPFVGMERALTLGNGRSLPDVAAAVAAYTLTPAWALRQESLTGSLEVGKQADLIVLDQHLFDVPVTDISETKVLLTLVGGVEVHRSDQLAP